MPIVIDRNIPAYSVLQSERIVVMDRERATSQDIRPIEIAILNLMPTKKETETQFMRLLSNSPLQVNITLIHTQSYRSRNTEAEYLGRFYKSFEDVKERHFDGMIVTGAPVEDMAFSSVAYWEELVRLFDWTRSHVTSTIFICWGAMAALHHFYGIEKRPLPQKLFGVFTHHKVHFDPPDPLMRGISDTFHICHSRHRARGGHSEGCAVKDPCDLPPRGRRRHLQPRPQPGVRARAHGVRPRHAEKGVRARPSKRASDQPPVLLFFGQLGRQDRDELGVLRQPVL